METTKPILPMNMVQQTQSQFQTIPFAQLNQACLSKYIEQGMVPCQIVTTSILMPNGTMQLQNVLVPLYNLLPQNCFNNLRQTSQQQQQNPSTTPNSTSLRNENEANNIPSLPPTAHPTIQPTPSFVNGFPSVSHSFAPIQAPPQNLPISTSNNFTSSNTVSKAPSVKEIGIKDDHNLNIITKNTNHLLQPNQIMSHSPSFNSENKQNNLYANTNNPIQKIKSTSLTNNTPVQSKTPEETTIAKQSLEEKIIPKENSNCEKEENEENFALNWKEEEEEIGETKCEEEVVVIEEESMNNNEKIYNHDEYEEGKENIEIDNEFVAGEEALETTNNLKQTNNHKVIEGNVEIIQEERKDEEIVFEIKTLKIEEKQTEKEKAEKSSDINLITNEAKDSPNLQNEKKEEEDEKNLEKKKNEVFILQHSNSDTNLEQSHESKKDQTNITTTTNCNNNNGIVDTEKKNKPKEVATIIEEVRNGLGDVEEYPSLIRAAPRSSRVEGTTKIVTENRSTSNSTTPRHNDSYSVAGSVSSSGDSLSVCSDTPSRTPSQKKKVKAFLYKTEAKCRVRVSRSITGEVVGILQKGVEVKITEVVGIKGRIVTPLDGYVSMRKKGKNLLKKVFEGVPTICLRNLPTDYLSRVEDIKVFLRKKGVRPSHVIWRINRGSGDFCNHAFVEFDSHNDAQKLKNMKDLRMHGEKLKIDWSRRYGKEIEI